MASPRSLPSVQTLLAVASVTLIAFARPAAGFTGGNHDKATVPAVAGRVSAEAVKVITDANRAVDEGPYHGGDHFDRNPGRTSFQAFQNGAAVFRAKRAAATDSLRAGNADAGLRLVGETLHTLQDLFSHSNCVDMTDAEQAALLAALDDPSLPLPEGLQLTGYDPDAFGFARFNPSGDTYEHGLYWGKHKDNSYAGQGRRKITRDGVTRTAFEWAMEAAQRASTQLVDDIYLGLRPVLPGALPR